MSDSTGLTGFRTANLPIIDYSRIEAFFSDKARDNVAENEKLLKAVNDIGFIYLKNHGITDEKMKRLFEYAKEFFALPVTEKEKIESCESKFFHGWFSPDRTSRAKTADQKEAFDIGDDNNLARPNQWPENWPEFRTDLNYFFQKCHEIHLVLLGTFAETQGLPKDYFTPSVNEKDHFFRLLHYPATTPDSIESRLRASPHTDYGTLTLLFNDNSGGLQIRGRDGQWLEVPPIPGYAIINIGDLLSRWFNGSLKSTEHRVVEPPADRSKLDAEGKLPARYALAWFGNPNRNAWIEPLSSCITAENPKRFEGVWAGKHVADRIAKLHKDGKAPEVWKDSMYRTGKQA
ncbi:related to gibberellin 20-oxidase [Rhynchosporium secalis]|uniref:Related to gibberellin 20-oxidase n=1 Tax=Rhynchosporium secalis TaxID=38038 RepID=A0A1E1MT11_RHYSE|nr:related to gibberellin 20-oxidase [Rhynchosporium secalis]